MLDKNNQSKCKMQFLNADLIFFKTKKAIETQFTLCGKSKLIL